MYVGGTTVERINSGIGSERQVPVNLQKTEQQLEAGNALIYADAAASLKDHVQQASNDLDDGDAPSMAQIWSCPSPPKLDPENCYMYIQDQPMKTTTLSRGEVTSNTATITIPDSFCDSIKILHMHDSLSITSIPADKQWSALIWCRVERCPKLDCLFTAPTPMVLTSKRVCYYLKTLWASQLLKARFIWNRNTVFDYRSFHKLIFLHVDFCPRLIHVLPFTDFINNKGRHLETLEIMWCSDLRAIFPLERSYEARDTVEFQKLKRIHLHELPKLHGICGIGRMYAPNLESIKIRGCWSLTCLPAVGGGTYKNKVECDCEKEWWDRLRWDYNHHHRSLYKPTHPQHYKKTLLRGSVLH